MYETEKNMTELFKDQLQSDDVTGIKQKISELRQLVNQAQESALNTIHSIHFPHARHQLNP